jgi:hypothetical protein
MIGGMHEQTLIDLAIFIGLGIAVFIFVGAGNRLLSAVNSFVGSAIVKRVVSAAEARSDQAVKPSKPPAAPTTDSN